MSRRIAVIALIIGLAGVLAGCGAVARFAPVPTPRPCLQVYDAARCDLIVDAVAEEASVPREEVVATVIVPEPTPEVQLDGTTILQTRSGGPLLIVQATLRDGTVREVTMCGGISAAFVPVCMDDPHLLPSSVTLSGYRDVPCFGEDTTDCATPHPAPDPAGLAAAVPISFDRLDIPIDHEGVYEIRIGEGSLPNGILTEAAFTFVDDWPDGVTIPSGNVLLDVRSLEPDGKPFDNYYLHGWREGVERVEAVLVFDVRRFEPGAVLSVEDVIVR
jgi:hypothetical protein